VQLDQNKDIAKATLQGSDDQAIANAVRDFVRKQECDIQDTLEEMYQNMGVETFKDMRRVLPISKTKLDWTGAQMKLSQMSGNTKSGKN
jgi:capping protein alpha